MTNLVIGCDECGNGALAGPFVVCGVKATEDWTIKGLNDSKKLKESRRLHMGDLIVRQMEEGIIQVHMSFRSSAEMDRLGYKTVFQESYCEVFESLAQRQPFLIIVDGDLKFDSPDLGAYTIKAIPRADAKFPTVMAASILAKNYLDNYMRTMHLLYPQYGWDENFGYYCNQHIDAIKKYGFSPLHRRSYKIKCLSEQNNGNICG